MKKIILTICILLMAQSSYAAVAGRMSKGQAGARVERSHIYKEIVAARDAGKDITRDAKLMEKVTKMLDLSLKDLVIFSTSENVSLIKLINISAKDVLTEVARLSSIAKDTNATAQEKDMAKKSLELLVKASHTVDSLVVNSEQAQTQKETVTKIIEISDKISSLDFGVASKTFVEKYEKALTEGKTVADAIRIAANNKFSEKDLRDCQ